MTKCQGWMLCAEGAKLAAEIICFTSTVGIFYRQMFLQRGVLY